MRTMKLYFCPFLRKMKPAKLSSEQTRKLNQKRVHIPNFLMSLFPSLPHLGHTSMTTLLWHFQTMENWNQREKKHWSCAVRKMNVRIELLRESPDRCRFHKCSLTKDFFLIARWEWKLGHALTSFTSSTKTFDRIINSVFMSFYSIFDMVWPWFSAEIAHRKCNELPLFWFVG